MRLLLTEDDQEAARLLAKGLREEGWVVDIAHSGDAGDEMASVNTYDAIVLDWMLPDRDGVPVCRSLRASGLQAPILVLTARDATSEKVENFEAGADDYLTKPFAFAELLVRVKSLLRRGPVTRSSVLRAGDLELDRLSQQLRSSTERSSHWPRPRRRRWSRSLTHRRMSTRRPRGQRPPRLPGSTSSSRSCAWTVKRSRAV